MFIGIVDKKNTSLINKRLKKKIKYESYKLKNLNETVSNVSESCEDSETENETEIVNVSEENFQLKDKKVSNTTHSISLPTVARELDRCGLSDRAGALITSAVFLDLNLITKEDRSSVVDKNKIIRERTKARDTISATFFKELSGTDVLGSVLMI